MESSFYVLDYLGKPIQQIIESPYFKPIQKPLPQPTQQKGKTTSPPRVGAATAPQELQIGSNFEIVNTKSGNPKGTFYTCRERGFQAFCIESSGKPHLVDYFVLFNEVKDKYGAYSYKLPHRVQITNRNQDIVKKFGDTKDKGGGTVPIWIRYEHIGIEFQFVGTNWNDVQNPIEHIKLFNPTKQQTECTICLKSLSENIKVCVRGCGLKFCSIECYTVFSKVHDCPLKEIFIIKFGICPEVLQAF